MKTPYIIPRALILILDVSIIFLLCIVFYMAPVGFDELIACFCFFIFFLFAVVFCSKNQVIFNRIKILFSIEVGFTVFYYILFYHPYVVHLFGLGDYRINRFLSNTFEAGANKGLVCATIAYVALHLGTILHSPFAPSRARSVLVGNVSYFAFDIILLFVLFIFIVYFQLLGIQSSDIGRYSNPQAGGVVADGIYIVIITLCLVAIGRVVEAFIFGGGGKAIHTAMAMLVVYWGVNILIAGDRNNFLLLALAAFGGVAAFHIRIRLPFIIFGLAAALLLYKTVEVVRTMPEPTLAALVQSISDSGSEGGLDSFGNTTATLRATFEITPLHVPYALGLYKLVGAMGVVPLVRGVLFDGYQGFLSSADALTYYMIGPYAGWGLGTNIVSDLYMEFGLYGVCIGMIFIGVMISYTKWTVQARRADPIAVFLYCSVFGTVAELPRYSFDFPVRPLFWGLSLFVFYNLIMRLRTVSPR